MSKRNPNSPIRTGSQILPVVGKTTDNKLVMAGVYDIHQTQGLPLDCLFGVLKQNQIMVDWIDFYKMASYNGMKHERIISKIRDPIEDVWGVEFANKVCGTLNNIYKETKK